MSQANLTIECLEENTSIFHSKVKDKNVFSLLDL